MSTKIGDPKYSGDFTKRKDWKLKDGESVFRILPPIGFDGATPGDKWSEYYEVHYGYRNSKGQMRVFQSPQVKNRKTKMVEVPDAALERIEKLKGELKKATDSGNKSVADKLTPLVGGQKAQYNLDKNHYVNAMDQQGNIGVLKLRYRAKVALDATRKSLRDSGVDPIATDGRFLVFRRSGMGLDTTFQVDVLKKKFKVEGVGEVEQAVVHTLTQDIIDRLGKEARDLSTLYKRPTSEEVARIVKESDLFTGKSPAVDEILDTKQYTSNDDGSEEEQDDSSNQTSNTVTTRVSTQTVSQTAAMVVTAPAPMAQMDSVPTQPLITAMTPNQTDSDEAFLRSLGL